MEEKIIEYKDQLKNTEEIMDLEELLEMLNGNIQLVKMFMQKFYDDFRTMITEIEKYILEREYEEARKLVHKIKGASGNLRFTQVYQDCCSLEDVLKIGEERMIVKKFENFSMSMNNILMLINEKKIKYNNSF